MKLFFAVFSVISIIMLFSIPSHARPRTTYGFVNMQMTCTTSKDHWFRIRVTSQVFGYCYEETSSRAVFESVADEGYKAGQAVCPGELQLTNGIVESYSNAVSAQIALIKARNEIEYFKLFPTFYVVSGYSALCR